MTGTFVSLSGFLSADPILEYTPGGKPVCNFVIVVPRRRDVPSGDAHFFDCTVWGTPAEELAGEATKGYAIAVTGKLISEEWTGDNGEPYRKTRIDVDTVSGVYL